MWFAICTDCRPILPMPFHDPRERDVWVEKHRNLTRHEVLTRSGKVLQRSSVQD